MAQRGTRKPVGYYRSLIARDTEELGVRREKIIRDESEVLEGSDIYEVDRAIATRINEDGIEEYLILWKNFPIQDASWEPSSCVSVDVKRLFINPQVEDSIIHAVANEFCIFVKNALRKGSKCSTVGSITFRHDVYKVLFGNKNELYSSDFSSNYFPNGWNQYYVKTSAQTDGVVVDFPIKTWKRIAIGKGRNSYYIHDGKPVEKRDTFREVVKFEIVKVNKTL